MHASVPVTFQWRHLRKHRQVRDDRGNHAVSSPHRLHRHLSAQEGCKEYSRRGTNATIERSLARYLKEHPQVKYEYHDVTMDEVKELVWLPRLRLAAGA